MRQRVACALLFLPALLFAQTPREQAIRDLIQTLADARNAGNGALVAALYSDDGEWIPSNPFGTGASKGREALTKLWTNLPGKVRRTVSSIDFPAPRIAVVRVDMRYDPKGLSLWQPIGLHHEVLILVEEDSRWKIRVHQTVD
jgi:uncharacterized protein (TIGR02246 family)